MFLYSVAPENLMQSKVEKVLYLSNNDSYRLLIFNSFS